MPLNFDDAWDTTQIFGKPAVGLDTVQVVLTFISFK